MTSMVAMIAVGTRVLPPCPETQRGLAAGESRGAERVAQGRRLYHHDRNSKQNSAASRIRNRPQACVRQTSTQSNARNISFALNWCNEDGQGDARLGADERIDAGATGHSCCCAGRSLALCAGKSGIL